MLAEFFQTMPVPANHMTGTYNISIVALSYLVAVFASYIALDITGRLRDIGNTKSSKMLWIIGGACAMGTGIWSMHFIGMLAFDLPGMPMGYDPFWTSLSMLVAILASAFALFLLKTEVINVFHLACGGILFGLAIVSMHYLGMEAMKVDMDIHYQPGLFTLSIVIAIFASEAALWLALKSNQVVPSLRVRLKLISALIMGAAICGMHYTGMFAAVFTPLVNPLHHVLQINQGILAVSIAVVTFVILGIAFFVSTYKEALNQQLFENARQAGMSEVAVSVLHNVGNVLNSLYVSSNIVAEKITKSRLTELSNLGEMLNKHQSQLGVFLTEDPRGAKIPDYINALADYWKEEQFILSCEMETLLKNLRHVKDIISVQQDLSKTVGLEQVISMNTLVEEALLITGFDSDKIMIEKKYGKLKPALVNKVKLAQILVNILHNAKDALLESKTPNKLLILQIGLFNNENVFIKIIDNGIGISPQNLKRVFIHGFSTKTMGHGFGLHASAIAVNEMDGSIKVESDGLGKGATFTVVIPYKLPK